MRAKIGTLRSIPDHNARFELSAAADVIKSPERLSDVFERAFSARVKAALASRSTATLPGDTDELAALVSELQGVLQLVEDHLAAMSRLTDNNHQTKEANELHGVAHSDPWEHYEQFKARHHTHDATRAAMADWLNTTTPRPVEVTARTNAISTDAQLKAQGASTMQRLAAELARSSR